MRKRGQIQISFGMIFSIIIIIAILVSAFIVIKWILGNQISMEINLFIEDIKDEVDKTYKSQEAVFTLTKSLPTAIEYVCFINMPDKSGISNEIAEQIKTFSPGDNLFLVPGKKARGRGNNEIENIKFDNFCLENTGKVTIKFEKAFEENFVRIKKG